MIEILGVVAAKACWLRFHSLISGIAKLPARKIRRRLPLVQCGDNETGSRPSEYRTRRRFGRDDVLATYLVDVAKARYMQLNGSYLRDANRAVDGARNSQQWFIDRAVAGSSQ